MKRDDFSLESRYRIHNRPYGVCVELRRWPEADTSIELYPPEKADKEFHGDVHFLFTPEEARKLAIALNRLADEIDESEGESNGNSQRIS